MNTKRVVRLDLKGFAGPSVIIVLAITPNGSHEFLALGVKKTGTSCTFANGDFNFTQRGIVDKTGIQWIWNIDSKKLLYNGKRERQKNREML